MHSTLTELGRAVSQTHPLVVAVGIAALGSSAALSSWRGWRSLSRLLMIEDLPTSKARSAPQGYVELEGVGQLMDGPPIVAPLSGLPCVWYRYRVEELVTSYNRGSAQRRWETVEHGQSTSIFWLTDDTGRVAVDPEGAEILPKYRDVWRSRPGLIGFARQPAYVVKFVASRPSGANYRFTEERINPGDHIYALGLLKNVRSLAAAPTVDEEVRELLHEWKSDQATLKRRFDLNKDGQIDEREWLLARSQARREVLQTRSEQSAQFSDGINVLTKPSDARRPYLISAYRQSQLIKRYRQGALLYLAGFFALGAAAIWLLHARFG